SVTLQRLDDSHDVAFAVLEPRGLRASGRHDAALALLTGHVVVLENDAALLELRHFAFDVLDIPERLACARRSRIRRRIQEAGRILAEFIDDAAGPFLHRLEAELAFVESAGAIDVLRGNVRIHREFLQHIDSPRGACEPIDSRGYA